MTGEVTLRGLVLPVGGVKEKVLAAHRGGIRHVILPERNEKDLDDLPEEIRRDLTFTFARHLTDALPVALGPMPDYTHAGGADAGAGGGAVDNGIIARGRGASAQLGRGNCAAVVAEEEGGCDWCGPILLSNI
jgi:hypothetical protein